MAIGEYQGGGAGMHAARQFGETRAGAAGVRRVDIECGIVVAVRMFIQDFPAIGGLSLIHISKRAPGALIFGREFFCNMAGEVAMAGDADPWPGSSARPGQKWITR